MTHSSEVQRARANIRIPCGPGGTIHDYVPFYFGARSPMLLQLQTGQVEGYTEGQEPLIYLVSNAQAIAEAGRRFVFSDGHGLARFTEWHDDLARLDVVDWKCVAARQWNDTAAEPDRQRRKQAEFLIHNFCPWPLIQEIVVLNSIVKKRVVSIMKQFTEADRRPVRVNSGWYY